MINELEAEALAAQIPGISVPEIMHIWRSCDLVEAPPTAKKALLAWFDRWAEDGEIGVTIRELSEIGRPLADAIQEFPYNIFQDALEETRQISAYFPTTADFVKFYNIIDAINPLAKK